MAGIMLDSTNPEAVVAAVRENREWRGSRIRAAALYIDGSGAAPAAMFTALRSRVAVVEITVFGTVGAGAARVKAAGDVEPGDMDPATAAKWALDEVNRGAYPVLYSDRSEKPDIIAECDAQGMTPGHSFGLWTATLDGTFTDLDGSDLRTQPGMVAVQFAPAADLGIDADASVLTQAGEKWLQLTPTWQSTALGYADRLRDLLRQHA
jgi:hypothetical protein